MLAFKVHAFILYVCSNQLNREDNSDKINTDLIGLTGTVFTCLFPATLVEDRGKSL